MHATLNRHPPTPNCNPQLTFLHPSTYKGIGTTPLARSQYSVLISVRTRVTELVQPVLVLCPFLVSGVDPTGLASSKQASTREMGKNHSSVMVLRIEPKF